MTIFDLSTTSLRVLNQTLHGLDPNKSSDPIRIVNPSGDHSIAVGVDAPVEIEISGHVGYFCGGMTRQARITINGNAGQGVGENIESGMIHVKGDASQAAGATGRGGLLLVDGNASARCGISMKGVDIVVKGDIGHLSAFMGQTGRLVVFGEAGESLGDSLYEAKLFVRGKVASLGVDCIEKEMRDEHRAELHELLKRSGDAGKIDVSEFRRYGSARQLYNFNIDNAGAY
jgi:glutamate synthase domain-containing protein 3